MKIKPCIRFALALFVWVLLFSPQSVMLVGFAVLLHESGHLAACVFLKVKILSVTPMPWGMNITTPAGCNMQKKLIISFSGPLANFLVLLICIVLKEICNIDNKWFDFFEMANFAGGILNLIPAIPLDGGVSLCTVLMCAGGCVSGFKKIIRISTLVGILLTVWGAAVMIATGYNFSYCAVGVFIIFNLSREKQQISCIKGRILVSGDKTYGKIKFVFADASSHALCLLDFVTPHKSVVFIVNLNGRYIGSVSQKQIICELMNNSSVTIGECAQKVNKF